MISQFLRKKRSERRLLTHFFRLRPDLHVGRTLSSESPDFVMHTKMMGEIAIELTKLYKPRIQGKPSLKAVESSRRALIQELDGEFDKYDHPNCEIVLYLSDDLIHKTNRTDLAKRIVNVVLDHLPERNTWTYIENDYNSPRDYPFEVNSIRMARYDSLTQTLWVIPESGWMQTHFDDLIQKSIDAKEAKKSNYRGTCESFWLVIVVEGFSPSSFFAPSKETVAHAYRSSYDRVFLLDIFGSAVHELKTQAYGSGQAVAQPAAPR